MTLEQLRIFLAVAEREHVTRAAEALNLTQSTVSAAVSALEARLGLPLFDRVGRRIVLTEAGRVLMVEARAVLARAAQAEAAMADLAGLARGELAIAASQTVATYWLPPILHRFRTRCPAVALHLSIANSAAVARQIEQGLADLGLIEDDIDAPALAAQTVAEDEMVLVMAPGQGAPIVRPLTPGDLKAMTFVFREPGSGTRALFERAVAEMGVRPADLKIALELPSNEAVRIAAEHGAGAAALSRQVVAGALKAGTLVTLDMALPRRAFTLLRHRERTLSPAARAFTALLAEPAAPGDQPV
ncbi:DNA-binding transcriptional LysR family regulator [Rhodovulum iodosum]|uniref:DNA-binding transcriptional LysR family regulator n=1 Tax=Rhodovulum iodosum TaxID=68291 RepID=A0ABV3XW77_9RHOB|nr:LysR family transcriptional regulator [Rhodovulum robiginosum]RSK36719.1 LysR family transcriptional regulator [Rhodovulum robiginosum]